MMRNVEPRNKIQRILLVEDDQGLQKQMQWALHPAPVVTAGTRSEALRAFEDGDIRLVILDLGLPPDPDGATEGLRILDAILSSAPQTKVIILSGNANREVAVAAVARGAFDFVSKPVDIEVLKLIVQRAERMFELEEENRTLRAYADKRMPGFVYGSSQMQQVAQTIERVARTDASVLVLGESGTGKELIARALHESSPRANAKLVAINCASIPENLLESELFGHERGAFTGAVKQTLGKFEIADKGTLFLDEIGDMPLALQAKLLRFLQSKQLERVGGRQTLSVNVRVISATNQPLTALVKEGRFREDLYYRLNEIRIDLPALRDRDGDAIILAQHFRGLYAREHGRNLKGFTKDALMALQAHKWPGNVRELENRVKRAVIMTDGPLITAEDLELVADGKPRNLNLRDHMRELEGALLREALAVSDGNVSKAAKLMGISRPQVYNLLSAQKRRA
ncbi:two-component system NtrC family response regulator [Rhizomicrobium palustre]|uniref:Two-component system NtrC family response regulator n=1 Tax=Rhizomicrobium palustre TaxID=189966 RepID=A0A846MTM8_9PROT|nr:PEP-CTERM-box response regulator transcription factor [Rhizomicrobium palustre]NIK86716.1 two-component system NtrC family response regulator [Rhizomicrobium palustre]